MVSINECESQVEELAKLEGERVGIGKDGACAVLVHRNPDLLCAHRDPCIQDAVACCVQSATAEPGGESS